MKLETYLDARDNRELRKKLYDLLTKTMNTSFIKIEIGKDSFDFSEQRVAEAIATSVNKLIEELDNEFEKI